MARLTGIRQQLIRAAVEAPFLGREEEHALALRWKHDRDQKALDQLSAAHLRLVIAIAARFRNYGLSLADLVQEGHIGLMEAAARFEPDRDVRFSTYATWWIRASIQDFILRNWSIVRGGTSSAQKALFFNLRRLRSRLGPAAAEAGRDVTVEIAEALGVSHKDVVTMEARLGGGDEPLNAPMGGGDEAGPGQRQDFLADEGPNPEEAVSGQIDEERRMRWLRAGLDRLSDRERNILRERRLRDESMTLEALGQRLGISKERVRQIENRAMEKLRRALMELQPDARAAFI